MADSGTIRVGTCSWTEKSLIESGEFYPKAGMTAEERLKFYAARFDTVEVDAAYYAIPPLHTVELWAERTPPGFTFHVKAYGALTGHGIDPRTLPPVLRERLPVSEREQRSIHIADPPLLAAIAEAFAASLAPLRAAGKLGLVVFQFPPWFRYESDGLARILACRDLMGDLPLAVEFRHGSWLTDRHRSEVLAFLRDNHLCYVTADEPWFGTLATVPFLPEATTDVAYLRLHGRNAGAWLKKGGETWARYDYLYATGELEAIAGAARQLAARARVVFVMFNNCRAGHAMKNALEMLHLLG